MKTKNIAREMLRRFGEQSVILKLTNDGFADWYDSKCEKAGMLGRLRLWLAKDIAKSAWEAARIHPKSDTVTFRRPRPFQK